MKIISFSLWGQNAKYCVGAVKNAKLAHNIYPGWICRFYVGTSVPKDIIEQLEQSGNTELIFTDLDDWRLMSWRTLPISEKNVEVTILRDGDSRLTLREKLCVDEWIKSDFKISNIVDHPYHTAPLMGGLCGFKTGLIPNIKELLEQYNPGSYWQSDQEFLRDVIFRRFHNTVMYHNEVVPSFPMRAFPSKRKEYEFCGEVFDENDNPVIEHRAALAKALGKQFP
jgi:hypothetical protein